MKHPKSIEPPIEPQKLDVYAPSKSSNRYVLLFGGIMLVGLLFLAWVGRPPRPIIQGEPLPVLDLQPLVNADQPLTNADLIGKLSVLHFWGTWCPPCIEEFPEFAQLAAEFEGNDSVAIVSISCSAAAEYDIESLKVKTAAFLARYPGQIRTYADSAAMTRSQLALLFPNGTFGYPTTLLVDTDGKILDALIGSLPGDMEELAAKINARLSPQNRISNPKTGIRISSSKNRARM